MYKIGNPVYRNHMPSYNRASKLDGEFQNILEKQYSDELKECLDDRKVSFLDKNLTDEEFRILLKERLHVITEGRVFSNAEAERTGVKAYFTGEDVKRDSEFLMGGSRIFGPEWFDKNGNPIFSNAKANPYENLHLSGRNSKVAFNELEIGEGSKIDLGSGYSIQMHDGKNLYCYNNTTISHEDSAPGGKHHAFLKDLGELNGFITFLTHHANGDITSMWLGRYRDSQKEYLENMGIDTRKPFKINGKEFEYHLNDRGTGNVQKVIVKPFESVWY